MQRLLFEDITHFLMWCLSAHFSQRWFFLQNLIMWSNSWHLKHYVMQQFFSNSLHAHSWYKFSMLMFINWFIIALIMIFTMSNEWIFSLFTIFLSQTILKIFKSSWSFVLFFINLSKIFFWLLMSIVVCTSCVSIAKIQHVMHVELVISFAHVWVFFRFAWAFKLTAWRNMSSLLSLRSDIIKFLWFINMFIENMLHTLHATYIRHDLYADFFFRFKKLLREFFLQQIHSSRWTKSFTAQILTVYFLSMSCRRFISDTHAYHSWFLL